MLARIEGIRSIVPSDLDTPRERSAQVRHGGISHSRTSKIHAFEIRDLQQQVKIGIGHRRPLHGRLAVSTDAHHAAKRRPPFLRGAPIMLTEREAHQDRIRRSGKHPLDHGCASLSELTNRAFSNDELLFSQAGILSQ